MHAIHILSPGGPEVLGWGRAPDPTPAPGELLVRVHATAINRADLLQRRGSYPPPAGASPILGLELAGEVVQAAGDFAVGDRVMALVTGGGYAELATVPATAAMPIPAELSYAQAAAIPEAFLTAHLNLFTLCGLRAGEVALIHAGASGVGSAAIQLARAAGATVITTAGSAEKLAATRQLGADIAINYRDEDFGARVLEATSGRGADVILDFVGAPYWGANMAAAAQGGRMALIGFLGGSRGQIDLGAILAKSLTVTGTTLRRTPMPQKAALVRDFSTFALGRFASGELRPVIDRELPIQSAAEAHAYVERNQNIGKVVLTIA
ncbi:NAD(P)H-quinone oxidoreductase [Chloroflexia bacterium SDU3-3]|nr:NAD(P)H-quinone oxidoreductase [Chloroflexia bacterium SDU3-3]